MIGNTGYSMCNFPKIQHIGKKIGFCNVGSRLCKTDNWVIHYLILRLLIRTQV